VLALAIRTCSGFQSVRFLSKLPNCQRIFMQTQVKNALVTTAVVLGTIFVLNKISFTRPIVRMALD